MKSRSCLFLLIFLILLAFSSLALTEDMREVTRKGIAAIKQGDYDTAVDLLTRAIDSDEFSDEDFVYIYYNRGLAYLHKGEWDSAIEDCTEAIALKEDFAWAYNNRGLAWSRKGDNTRAIEDFETACDMGISKACQALRLLTGR